ncbi:MAG TPA: hypothetical protein VK612_00650 [Pyrinomonadaceae bacterium]|nr:hypothetical protein [Pyrinomonadaceae bacterium]
MDTVRLRRQPAKKVGFGERLSRSLEYLNFKARSHNAIASYELIERVLSEQRKYAMFREMFPKEWKRSRASLYRRGYYAKYSERVNELFNLVNDNCFPLLEFAYDDPENEFEQFAIPPMNVDLCCEDIYFENLKVSYSAALIFYFPDDAWDFLNQRFKVSRSDFGEIHSDPHPNVWDRKDGSLFGELLQLVDHSTGNPWLDSNYCQTADWYSWDRETIDALTAEYNEANKVFERLNILDELIEADPKKMLRALIDFWNKGEHADLVLSDPGSTGFLSSDK